jgi:hypothetical protein
MNVQALEEALEQPPIRTGAAVAVLILFRGLLAGIFSNLLLAVDPSVTFAFDGVWNFTYPQILAILITGGAWIALSAVSRFEQPWWMIVAGVFVAWSFIVEGIIVELPSFLANVLFAGIGVVTLVGVALALIPLTKHIPIQPAATPGAMPATLTRVYQSSRSSKSQRGRLWPTIRATALPTSRALPPPKAITPSWSPLRKAATPASTLAATGLPWTSENSRQSSPASQQAWTDFSIMGRPARPASVTKRGRCMPIS